MVKNKTLIIINNYFNYQPNYFNTRVDLKKKCFKLLNHFIGILRTEEVFKVP